ncbi:hypothetical protein PG994_008895 [Apiospora phragmitis]|uniref:Uncharacterized protein n=1 Tax=Apiospora phragmitis TaxID=2905665 RepID=A0ABR1UIB6_9PEZI
MGLLRKLSRRSQQEPAPSEQQQHQEPAPPEEQQKLVDAPPPPPPPEQQQQPQHQSLLPHQFPPSFIVYDAGLTDHHYVLGESQTTPPLYAVSFHAGWTGPDVELHSGRTESDPPLATARRGILLGESSTVKLPGPDADGPDGEIVKESVSTAGDDFPYPNYDFTIEVGPPAPGSPSTPPPPPQQQQERELFDEVVAVFEWTALTKKELYFTFVGSGATGILGERWAIMAVITAIRAWDRVRRTQSAPATGVTSGGGGLAS